MNVWTPPARGGRQAQVQCQDEGGSPERRASRRTAAFMRPAGLVLASLLCLSVVGCGKGMSSSSSGGNGTGGGGPGAPVAPAVSPWAGRGPSTGTSLSLIAGDIGGDGSIDGRGVAARFNRPADVVSDAMGNLYVADMANETVRKISPDGQVTTLAGLSKASGDADGPGASARFYTPNSVAVDPQGNVYVTDGDNHLVRKISPQGVVSTVAGVSGETGHADGPAARALFNSPAGIAVAADGTLFVADSDNHVIRKISPSGVVSTWAGLAEEEGSQDGTGGRARFSSPQGLTLDPASGMVFVADTGNDTLRKITPAGVVSTVAGEAGKTGHRDGVGKAARFNGLMGVRVDAGGVVWVVDGNNHVIRQVSPQGKVTTLAGRVGDAGNDDGPGAEARFSSPSGMALDAAGNAYVADTYNEVIRKVAPSGEVTTWAGWAPHPGGGNGTAEGARFNQPQSVAMDASGTLYLADRENHAIRKVRPSGMVTTLAGKAGDSGDDDGKGGQARFHTPQGLTVDASGKVIVADSHNDTLRQVTPDGVTTTIAGEAEETGDTDGPAKRARFNSPVGVRHDARGNLYIVDFENNTLRKLGTDGIVSTVAGKATEAGDADGSGAAARFSEPADLAVDAAGNVYVADHGNHVIRKVTPAGEVSTLAGVAGEVGFADGPGPSARFNHPQGLAFDESGNLFVADLDNHALRKVAPDGSVSTVIGHPNERGIRLGSEQPRLDSPTSVAWVAKGRLVVVSNHAVLLANVPAAP